MKCITEHTKTKDGFQLAIVRYPNNGHPIVLAHGLAANHNVWDFPIKDHSFAQYLARYGYDVWIPCLRGHGDGVIQSEICPEWKWTIDDLAIYDMDAILNKVQSTTNKTPFWVGHSMGGILAYMYLQGAEYRIELPSIIHANPNTAKQRQNKVAGLITIASPINIHYNDPTPFAQFLNLTFWQTNKLIPLLSRNKTFRKYIGKMKYIPVASFFKSFSIIEKIPVMGSLTYKGTAFGITQIVKNPMIGSLFWYPPNMNHQLIKNLLYHSLSDICGNVLDQFADWVAHSTFRSFMHTPQHPQHIYSNHLHFLKLPLLIISGEHDKIANHSVIYHQGFCRMGSDDKTYQCFEGFGHNDILVGLRSPIVIFPFIERWIRQQLFSKEKKCS